MQVLISGQQGFIAKNLVTFLAEKAGLNLLENIEVENKFDIVIYIAADNMLEGATNKICLEKDLMLSEIDSLAQKSHVLFVVCDDGDQDFISDIKKLKNKIVIYTVPEVFGKWSNSVLENPDKYVIGHYCRRVIDNGSIDGNNDSELELLYIDDLLTRLYLDIGASKERLLGGLVGPVYQIKKHELIDTLHSFKNSRKSLILDGVGSGLTRALYSTYISYLPADQFSYPVYSHNDSRGRFVEVIKTTENGQVSYFTANPGVTRGEHYHHSKTEKFLIIQGTARFKFRHLVSDEVYEINVDSKNPAIVESIPGWVHNITNTGNNELIVLLWANELFDTNNPDTIANET
jgi:UDP-2-acetamido-2,6-beta-L-arabino-hexul-4-ose reductase